MCHEVPASDHRRRAEASDHKGKGCNFSYGVERVVRTASNDDDVSNRTLALVSAENHHGNSEFLSSEQSGASNHRLNSWALCH